MMAITFGEMDDLDIDPFALNDGKPLFYANWYRTNRLGQLRERSSSRRPLTYSTWRFARSLYGNKGTPRSEGERAGEAVRQLIWTLSQCQVYKPDSSRAFSSVVEKCLSGL